MATVAALVGLLRSLPVLLMTLQGTTSARVTQVGPEATVLSASSTVRTWILMRLCLAELLLRSSHSRVDRLTTVQFYNDEGFAVLAGTQAIGGPLVVDWGTGPPAPGINENYWAAKFSALLRPIKTGWHSLRLIADSRARLSFHGARMHDFSADTSTPVFLHAARLYSFTVEYQVRHALLTLCGSCCVRCLLVLLLVSDRKSFRKLPTKPICSCGALRVLAGGSQLAQLAPAKQL